MSIDPSAPDAAVREFLAERHLASLTTLRPDGSPHVVPVGFTYEAETRSVRLITRGHSAKVRHARQAGARAAVCQIDGGRWLTLEGSVRVTEDADEVEEAVRRYSERYQTPRSADDGRVSIIITVDRILGRA